jgi:hypothetical protein
LFAYCCNARALWEVPEVCLLQTKRFRFTKILIWRFQNEYNKVEVELRVVQFWTEIKLVVTKCTPASRSCDFVITRLISVQIALHSVQLPLFIDKLWVCNKMISNSRMQITLLSFLFKKINIIKKGINIKDTLKLYTVLLSCFIYVKAVGF